MTDWREVEARILASKQEDLAQLAWAIRRIAEIKYLSVDGVLSARDDLRSTLQAVFG